MSENPQFSVMIQIFGDVFASDFPVWIAKHAHKLGLISVSTIQNTDHLEVAAKGPQEMLEALALACSLGPATVLVDEIAYTTHASA